jgi:hypothetical protein
LPRDRWRHSQTPVAQASATTGYRLSRERESRDQSLVRLPSIDWALLGHPDTTPHRATGSTSSLLQRTRHSVEKPTLLFPDAQEHFSVFALSARETLEYQRFSVEPNLRNECECLRLATANKLLNAIDNHVRATRFLMLEFAPTPNCDDGTLPRARY